MQRLRFAGAVLSAALLSGPVGHACGDKLLAIGRGIRFQRAYAARPANVVIYSKASQSGATLMSAKLQTTLKQAGLVSERPDGRNVFYRANPQGLEPMLEWMTRYAVFWSQRLDALERLLRQEDARKSGDGEKK